MKLSLTFLFIIFLIACQKKSVPIITERTRERILPAVDTVTLQADSAMGRTTFVNRCGRCHGLPLPEEYTTGRWVSILEIMARRARLNSQDKVNVLSFVQAHAKK